MTLPTTAVQKLRPVNAQNSTQHHHQKVQYPNIKYEISKLIKKLTTQQGYVAIIMAIAFQITCNRKRSIDNCA